MKHKVCICHNNKARLDCPTHGPVIPLKGKHSCKRCGGCCFTYPNTDGEVCDVVPITSEEANNIATFLKLSLVQFMRQYCIILGTQICIKSKEKCTFLVKDEDGQYACQIQSVKPVACSIPIPWENMGINHPVMKVCKVIIDSKL